MARTIDGEQLYSRPRNAVAPAPDRATQSPAGSHSVPVIARLVWPKGRVQLVPATVWRWTRDRVYLSWYAEAESQYDRSTWLARTDVRTSIEGSESSRRRSPSVWFGADHPLAPVVRSVCTHPEFEVLGGGVGCGPCWEAVLREHPGGRAA